MPRESERIKGWIFFYLCLVFGGCILANIFIRCGRNLEMASLQYVDDSLFSSVSVRRTLWIVFWERAKQVAVICLLYKVFPSKQVFLTGMSVLTFLFGFVLSCQMFYLGLSGVWYFLLCMFPHYLIYIGMLCYLAVESRRIDTDMSKKRLVFLVCLALFVLGVLAEGILSKIFLRNFLQYIGM